MLTDIDMSNPLTAQAAVFAALAQLAELHPALPGAYITTSQVSPTEASVLLDGPADFEAWRMATQTETDDVWFADLKGDRKLHFTAPLGRITLKVFTVFAAGSGAVAA
ncbi:hypothetical protein [Streptomyces nojiriensis]|uniref:hypothetical protein n=1 Tax=Streptomyces nojiriensis TaxID=66374 RepID=UPI003666D435